MHGQTEEPRLYGLMAEFATAKELVEACRRTHAAGYRKLDAYSPYPIHDLSHALHHEKSKVPFFVLCGGLVGALAGFGLAWFTSVHVYPMNIGGRPLNSWVSFIPVTFEMTILFAGLTGLVSMLALNGLPRPHHPVFNVPRFAAHASTDRFFLCIETTDPLFDRERTEAFLRSLDSSEVSEVEN